MRRLFVLIFLLCARFVFSQDNESWDKQWYVPDYGKIQYAGSMGMISAGLGYSIFKKHTDIDFYVGYLPQKYSSDDLYIYTFKFTQSLFKPIHINSKWSVTPATAGIYITYTLGEKFSTKLPNHYPSGYYWWSETLRPNLFIGGNVMYRREKASPVSFYYELGTNELKGISYVLNTKYLSVWDILHLGLGVKIAFHRK